MKKSWIRKDDKGVSPVIATILMVAITVVLAAVLYLMVSNFTDSDQGGVVTGSISTEKDPNDSGVGKIRFGTFNPSQKPVDLTINIENGTGISRYTYDTASEAWTVVGADNANTGASLPFVYLSDVTRINSGDTATFKIGSGFSYTVRIVIGGNEVATSTLNA